MRGRIVGLSKNTGFLRGIDSHGDGEKFDRMFHAGAGCVHPDSVSLSEMEEGDWVEFEPFLHARGERARQVRVVEKDGNLLNPAEG